MAKVIGRKPTKWFTFAMEEGGEVYRVPLVQSLPSGHVLDENGEFRLTGGRFRSVLAEYIGEEVVGGWSVEEISAIFEAWDDACGEGPDGVTTGESQS